MARLNSLPPLGNPISKKGILAALSKGVISNVRRAGTGTANEAAINSLVDAMKTLGLVTDNWLPDYLFENGELGAWFDPSDLSTLFQDSAGTAPVANDGDPVGLMLDKSGNGLHLSQVTASARPLYRTDGVLSWLEFDGVDDQLESVLTPFGATISEGSALIAAQEISRKAQVLFTLSGVEGSPTSARWWSHCPYSDGNIYFDAGDAVAPQRISAPAPFSAGTTFLGTFENSVAASSQSIRIDGSPLVSDTSAVSVTTAGSLSLGAAHAGVDHANAKIFGFLARVGTVLTAEEQAGAEGWLAARSGLTL